MVATDSQGATMDILHRDLQFGTGSSAGAVFLGSSQRPAPDGNATDDGTPKKGVGMVEPVDVVIYAVCSIVVVLVAISVTWCVAYISDRIHRPSELEDFDQGVVSKKAGLWGLRLSERDQLLEEIFERQKKTVFHFGETRVKRIPDPEEGLEMVDLSTPVPEKKVTIEVSPQKGTDDEISDDAPEAEEEEPVVEEELDDADHERICCVCLNEYDSGERVMTGTGCEHMFHYDCSLQWLKNHDHCPYCRKEMITPQEMRTAAEKALGEERVTQLSAWASERRHYMGGDEGEIDRSRHSMGAVNAALSMPESYLNATRSTDVGDSVEDAAPVEPTDTQNAPEASDIEEGATSVDDADIQGTADANGMVDQPDEGEQSSKEAEL